MRSIYIRSLLFAAGFAALLAAEMLAPRGVDVAPSQPVAVGAPHAPA